MNVFGVVRVTNAMLPLLRRVDHGTILNVSSAMGSLTLATTRSWEWYGGPPGGFFDDSGNLPW